MPSFHLSCFGVHCLKKVVDGAHTSDAILSPGIWKGLIELYGAQVHLVVVQISHVGRKSKIQKYRNLLTILTDDGAERWWKYQLNDNQYWRWWREYWWQDPVWSAVVQYFRWFIHWVVEIATELHRLDVEGGHDHLWQKHDCQFSESLIVHLFIGQHWLRLLWRLQKILGLKSWQLNFYKIYRIMILN